MLLNSTHPPSLSLDLPFHSLLTELAVLFFNLFLLNYKQRLAALCKILIHLEQNNIFKNLTFLSRGYHFSSNSAHSIQIIFLQKYLKLPYMYI